MFPVLYNICSFMAYGRIGLGEHKMACKSVGVLENGVVRVTCACL